MAHLHKPFLMKYRSYNICSTETIAPAVAFGSERIIAAFATYGCLTKSGPTTAPIAAFAASVEPRTFNIAMIVECALTVHCTTTTTARSESTSPIAQCVKSIYFHLVRPVTKCLAVMQFIGTVSGS
jgi:hypothetical protein